MRDRIVIDGVELSLAAPDDIVADWVGQTDLVQQLLACWLVIEPVDLPLNPRVIGRPGVGKTTLACAVARRLGQPAFLFQATADTRPEDLVVTPVLGDEGKIRYVASSIVSAMIVGGVAVLDEGNRMTEKSWASLAPVLDQRRYVESLIAGIKIKAHPDFRFCTTMNDDSSTYDLPEYISSRLLPKITVDFPAAEEERRILSTHLPFAPEALLDYVVGFLQNAHSVDASFSVRDGISLARYALKRAHQADGTTERADERVEEAILHVLGEDATEHLPDDGGDPGDPGDAEN